MSSALAAADDSAAPPWCVASEGLHCFAAADLAPLWRSPRGAAFDAGLVGATQAVASGSSGIAAFSHDGRQRWRRNDFGPLFAPRESAGALYVGSLGGNLLRLDPADGAVAWRQSLPGWVYSPALLGDRVVTGGSAGKLFAFERAGGRPLWTRDLGQELVHRPVETGDDGLIATTFDGDIALFDRRGERRWRRNFGVPARSPLVAGERLYTSLFDGRLVALSLADGALLWQRAFEQPVNLVAAGERLLAFGVDRLIVLDRQGETRGGRRFADELLDVRPLADGGLVVFLGRTANPPRAVRVDLANAD